jgi:hypothetical protein
MYAATAHLVLQVQVQQLTPGPCLGFIKPKFAMHQELHSSQLL